MADTQMSEDQDIGSSENSSGTYLPPSINPELLYSGRSYAHFSPVPPSLLAPLPPSDSETTPTSTSSPLGPPVAIGIDEAGRGPVLGPMVYGLFYLPLPLSDPLLRETHHFDDSKVLTPATRSALMRALCTPGSDLQTQCGWAVDVLSAREIGAGMMRPGLMYNLNAQAMDSTIGLIRGVYERGLNVKEIYVDTIGQPEAYQRKLARVFPAAKIVVAKKADSLFPCVSAASVCAKVTRDAALEVLYESYAAPKVSPATGEPEPEYWGSGYTSDARCTTWLRRNMHPIFGWGSECRFSWATAKDMLEGTGKSKGSATTVKVDWPIDDDEDEETTRLTAYFGPAETVKEDELVSWFGGSVGTEVF